MIIIKTSGERASLTTGFRVCASAPLNTTTRYM